MALDKSTLETEILVFNDSSQPSNMPSSSTDAGEKWAAAYATYLAEGETETHGGPASLAAAESAAALIIKTAIDNKSFSMQGIIDSFFSSLATEFATVFPDSLSVLPPTESIDESALNTTLLSATTSASANSAIAQAMHDASQGAIVGYAIPPTDTGPEDFA